MYYYSLINNFINFIYCKCAGRFMYIYCLRQHWLVFNTIQLFKMIYDNLYNRKFLPRRCYDWIQVKISKVKSFDRYDFTQFLIKRFESHIIIFTFMDSTQEYICLKQREILHLKPQRLHCTMFYIKEINQITLQVILTSQLLYRDAETVVSSANFLMIYKERSFMNKMNSLGPRTQPWGT